MVYILVAILMFGVLIAVHEFGHFITAKLFGIRVNEFSIGMGPALFKREKGETLYSLRLLPIGGYCAMEGEDEENDNPRSFSNKSPWRKLIILAAGSVMNFIAGFVLVAILFGTAGSYVVPVVRDFMDGFSCAGAEGLQAGDRIVSVNGHRIFVYSDLSTQLSTATGETMDLVVERDGEKVYLDNVSLPRQERTDEEGNTTNYRGITIGAQVLPAGLGTKLIYSWNTTLDYVRLVWVSLGDLVRGAVGIKDLSGPVGIVDTMSQVGSQSASVGAAIQNLLWLAALIAVNLAVMNLLPLPALDGGRVFFLLLNGVLFALFKRKIDAKYEGYVHLAGLAALMTLMLMVTFSDIGKIIAR